MPKVKGGTLPVKGTIKHYEMPQGTPEELRATWERAEDYLYRILSYAPKDREKELTKEELAEERRYLQFLRLGPRAGYLRHAKRNTKLTSADVLYILTCTLPPKHVADVYGVHPDVINAIRRNDCPEWYWEYYFVKRLKTHIKSEIYCHGGSGSGDDTYVRIYKLERLQKDNSYKILGYITGIRKAKRLREDLCPKKEYERLVKNGTLDIIWPITKIDLL